MLCIFLSFLKTALLESCSRTGRFSRLKGTTLWISRVVQMLSHSVLENFHQPQKTHHPRPSTSVPAQRPRCPSSANPSAGRAGVRVPGTASASRTPRPNRVTRRAVPLPAPHPGEQTGPGRGELRREERGLILSHPTKLYLSIKTGALQECDAPLPRGQGPRLCQIRAGSRLALGPPAPAAFRVLMAFLLCPPRPHFISLFNAF